MSHYSVGYAARAGRRGVLHLLADEDGHYPLCGGERLEDRLPLITGSRWRPAPNPVISVPGDDPGLCPRCLAEEFRRRRALRPGWWRPR